MTKNRFPFSHKGEDGEIINLRSIYTGSFQCSGQRKSGLSVRVFFSFSFSYIIHQVIFLKGNNSCRGPMTSKEGKSNHESSQGKGTRRQDASKGVAAPSLLRAHAGKSEADAPPRPAFSSQHPSAIKG